MSRTLFKNCTIVGGNTPEAQQGRDVIVDGNHIAAIQATGLPVADVDRTFDVAGKTLMPGMHLGHAHMTFGQVEPPSGATFSGPANATNFPTQHAGSDYPSGVYLALALKNCANLLESGVTSYSGAGTLAEIDHILKLTNQYGLFDTPRILACGKTLNSTGHDNDTVTYWRGIQSNTGLEAFADGPDEIRKLVRTEIRSGARIIKVTQTGGHGGIDRGRGFTKDELAALVEAAHHRGAKVRSHCVWTDDIKELVRLGVDVIDHGDGVDEEAIELMIEHDTTWVPSVALTKFMVSGSSEFLSADGVGDDYERLKTILPLANKAGVRIVPGDDYGAPFMPHTPGIYATELALYVDDFGISEADVIRWATRNGGEMMGENVGVVEEGALADLIVVDGNPLVDIHVLSDTSRIPVVMVDGKVVKDKQLVSSNLQLATS